MTEQEPPAKEVTFLDEYQIQAAKTNKPVEEWPDFATPELDKFISGIAGEGGEINEKWKKAIREDDEEYIEEIIKELGDLTWYIALTADELGVSLSTVASQNLSKLADREERGVIMGGGDDR